MAKKPGACDLRCNEAVLSAFLSNPAYSLDAALVATGRRMVKSGNWAFARYLPPDAARDSLEGELPLIARKQQTTGLWFRKNAPILSYLILLAIKRAGLLDEVRAKWFRHDAFAWFEKDDGELGYIGRRNVIGTARPGDDGLQRRFVAAVAALQQEDGSWGAAVSATALTMERLLDLGCSPQGAIVGDGAAWLLAQYRDEVGFRRPKASWSISMGHVFTTEDHGKEFLGAQKALPHAKLAFSCFGCLPMTQTALALRVLSRSGYHGDERVVKSFACLARLQIKPEDIRGLAGNASPGDWCAHKCRFKLEDEAQDERRKRKP